MKKCNRCKIEKQIESFAKNSRNKDGKQNTCKACHSELYIERSSRYEKNFSVPDFKKCNDCNLILPSNDFYQSSKRSDGLYSYCKDCSNLRTKASTFGLTIESLKQKLSEQPICEVCGSSQKLVIDHDHSCCPGKGSCGECIRGILCTSCNLAEGHIKNSQNAKRLFEYLLRNKR